MAIGHRLPYSLSRVLFGDRKKWGLTPNINDSCWQQWESMMPQVYNETQRQGIGKLVNEAGYKIMRRIDLKNKKVLEIGPGGFDHMPFWQTHPKAFYIADRRKEMLLPAKKRLKKAGIQCEQIICDNGIETLIDQVPQVDIIISFYNLEHLYPLDIYLETLLKLLKPGGQLVGAIPTEGGLAWGIGRYFTTRRWFKNNTNINPDKIICWEHPNFSDTIITELKRNLKTQQLSFWPLRAPLIDINLVMSFIYEKK